MHLLNVFIGNVLNEKSQVGVKENKISRSLSVKQLLEFVKHPRYKNTEDKICNTINELAINTPVPKWFVSAWVEFFQKLSTWWHHGAASGRSLLIWVKVQLGTDFFWRVLWFLNMWSYHSMCQQQTIAVVSCAKKERRKGICSLFK